MEKFMMIIREDLAKMRKMTDEERFANIPMMLKWVDSLIETGNFIKGEPLLPKRQIYQARTKFFLMAPLLRPAKGFRVIKLSGRKILNRLQPLPRLALCCQAAWVW